MNIFDGLLGYEKLMLVCGFILFVFALAVIVALIAKGRDFKAATVLFPFAAVLMGYPGIQAVKFSQGMVELNRIRTQPQAPAGPAQQQARQVLGNLEKRAADNPRLQAQVADGYRAIGEVDKAYRLAQAVLQQHPSAQVKSTLVPVLTAKLNQVQAGTLADTRPTPPAYTSTPASVSGVATGGNAAAPPPAVVVASPDQRSEIAEVVKQLQNTGTPLPAASHVALAKAYVALDQPLMAQASIEAARRADPQIQISPVLSREIRARGVTPVEH